ncbi:MAG: hypothetical protein UF305_01300 [Oscillospiraceae bacterium]|nr:hypothetical protein [Oscillospiraceae bacterium]
MVEYIDKNATEKALTVAAANGKDKDRRTWAKAICVLHDMPVADVSPAEQFLQLTEENREKVRDYVAHLIKEQCTPVAKMDGGI